MPTVEARERACVCCASDPSLDCRHLKAALSWWCTNPNAIKYRGTSIPGVKGCPFFEPKPERLAIVARIKAAVNANRAPEVDP